MISALSHLQFTLRLGTQRETQRETQIQSVFVRRFNFYRAVSISFHRENRGDKDRSQSFDAPRKRFCIIYKWLSYDVKTE